MGTILRTIRWLDLWVIAVYEFFARVLRRYLSIDCLELARLCLGCATLYFAVIFAIQFGKEQTVLSAAIVYLRLFAVYGVVLIAMDITETIVRADAGKVNFLKNEVALRLVIVFGFMWSITRMFDFFTALPAAVFAMSALYFMSCDPLLRCK